MRRSITLSRRSAKKRSMMIANPTREQMPMGNITHPPCLSMKNTWNMATPYRCMKLKVQRISRFLFRYTLGTSNGNGGNGAAF